MIITIDGPVASGKSSVAKEIGNRLGLFYLNTGLLYRAVAYILIHEFRKKINLEFPFEVSEQELDFINEIVYEFIAGQPHVIFKGKDITVFLTAASLDQDASIVSACKILRDKLLPVQQNIGKKYNIIADGRDCGTVVFPNADYKFFLTASVEARVKRVLSDPKRKVQDSSYDKVKNEIEARDARDWQRAIAPLKIADDAVVIDSSDLSFEQTVQAILQHIKNPARHSHE
ncbi:MAG: (d)CMP kinase [Candidatus Babeliales bacterium]